MPALNIISDLYIWVHPGNSTQRIRILREWKASLIYISRNPHAALVETTNTRNHVPYGQIADQCSDDKEHLEAVGKLESMAASLFGDRFLIWPHANFIYGRSEEHEQTLRKAFNVTRRIMDGHRTEKLFRFAACFGLEPEACSYWQAYDYGLHKLAHDYGNHGLSPLGSLRNR